MRRQAALVGALLLLSQGSSCKKSAKHEPEAKDTLAIAESVTKPIPVDPKLETLVLGQVLLETSDPDQLLGGQEGRLATALGEHLVSSGWLVASAEDVPDGRVPRQVEASLSLACKLEMPAGDSRGSIAIAVQSSLRFVSASGADIEPRTALLVEQAFDTQDLDEVHVLGSQIFASAVNSAGESLAAQVRLRQSSDEDLLAALSSGIDEPGMKIWALELAGERGLRGAVPSAIAALSADDEVLRSAAIAALVAIGEPRAVAALSQDVDFQDYEELAMVMEAVSAIGGEDAVAFLEFVRSGHADADLRQRADECIQRLQKQESGSDASGVN